MRKRVAAKPNSPERNLAKWAQPEPPVTAPVTPVQPPAAQRAIKLKDRFTFKTEMDDEARRYLFPQNVAQAA